MSDTESIIQAAIDAARDSDSIPNDADGELENVIPEGDDDASTDTSGDADPGTRVEGDATPSAEGNADAGDGGASDGTPPEPAKKSAWSEEDLGILKELGIKPEPSGKDNRMPYSKAIKQVVKHIKQDRARIGEIHTKALKDETNKRKELEAEVDSARNLDKLLQSDPDRYLGVLAGLYPDKYKRFVETGTTKAQPAAKADLSTKPQPDVKFADGSTGYSPEQLDKLNDWVADQAVAKARTEFQQALDKQVGPIVKEREANAEANRRLTTIRGQISSAEKTWGAQLYKENETAILEALRAEDTQARTERRQAASFEIVVARVLVPKLEEKSTKARELVLEEMKKAPKAAATKSPSQTREVETDEPKTTVDLVQAAVNRFKASRR